MRTTTAIACFAFLLTACTSGSSIEPVTVTTFPPDTEFGDDAWANLFILGAVLETHPALLEAFESDQQVVADIAGVACGAVAGTDDREGLHTEIMAALDDEQRALITRGDRPEAVLMATLWQVYCPDA